MAVDIAPGPAIIGIAKGTTAIEALFLSPASASGSLLMGLFSAFNKESDSKNKTNPPAS